MRYRIEIRKAIGLTKSEYFDFYIGAMHSFFARKSYVDSQVQLYLMNHKGWFSIQFKMVEQRFLNCIKLNKYTEDEAYILLVEMLEEHFKNLWIPEGRKTKTKRHEKPMD